MMPGHSSFHSRAVALDQRLVQREGGRVNGLARIAQHVQPARGERARGRPARVPVGARDGAQTGNRSCHLLLNPLSGAR